MWRAEQKAFDMLRLLARTVMPSCLAVDVEVCNMKEENKEDTTGPGDCVWQESNVDTLRCLCQEMCIHSNPAGYANFQSIEGGLSGASSFCTELICRMQ